MAGTSMCRYYHVSIILRGRHATISNDIVEDSSPLTLYFCHPLNISLLRSCCTSLALLTSSLNNHVKLYQSLSAIETRQCPHQEHMQMLYVSGEYDLFQGCWLWNYLQRHSQPDTCLCRTDSQNGWRSSSLSRRCLRRYRC